MKTKIAVIEVIACVFCPQYDNKKNYCNRHGVQLSKGYSSSEINKWTKNIAMNDNIPAFCTLPDKDDCSFPRV